MAKDQDIAARVDAVVQSHSVNLQREIEALDPQLLAQIGVRQVQHGATKPGDHFSDWRDTFSDRGGWSKTWGRAGFDAPVDEFVFPVERSFFARLRAAIKYVFAPRQR